MTPSELDRVLAAAEEAGRLREVMRRADALRQEIAQLDDVVAAAPRVHAGAGRVAERVEPVARELEREWVAQGPLVAAWQRAADLAQLAEAAGADVAPYRDDVDDARRRVEAARLATREQRERLAEHRDRLADALLAAPLELDPPPPVADDARPEALRRDALELIRLAAVADRAASEAAAVAAERRAGVRAELARLGQLEDVAARLAELEQELPGEVELDADAPPSVAMRLRRAGISVR
jgi:hypothetical protein